MEQEYSVLLSDIVKEFNMEILHRSADYESRLITTPDINRPAMQLMGFYDYFAADRLQMIGIVETTYLINKLSAQQRRESFAQLFEHPIPALVICHQVQIIPECIEMAEKYDIPVLKTEWDTSDFMAAIIESLKEKLAPRITRHGVLVEVYGEGILLLGESGVGKSETAIELVKRGHRLIADDAVEIKKVALDTLMGSAPELIRHYIELRGIGVIDVRRLFGMGAIKPTGQIDLVINLEIWKDGYMYDRLGISNEYTSILGVKVPSITVPVKPGRNLAVIIEVAAMNNREKKMGYNSALEFTKQINEHFDESLKDVK